jgi:hypothetical protein
LPDDGLVRADDQLKAEDEEEASEIVRNLQEGKDEEQVEDRALAELPRAGRRNTHVVVTMRALLEGHAVNFEELELSRDERSALEVLQQVVTARGRRGSFIYAETRLARLDRVLAVLQPALAVAFVPGAEALRDDLNAVVDQVDELRERLNGLDGAQEEYMFQETEEGAVGEQDEDDPNVVVPPLDAPPRPSTLATGPAAPDVAGRPSTLAVGPAAPDLPVRPSTLATGPAAPDLPVRPSTLATGPAAPDWVAPPSTLSTGPAAPDFAPGPSTLGEPEPAAATRKGR